jgi:hypothetical protein
MSDSRQAANDAEPATPTIGPSTPAPFLPWTGEDAAEEDIDPEKDPEIQALLDFEPVPRKIKVEGGWSPAMQRRFIARLAVHGSACRACEELGKNRTGVTKLYRSPHGASFRAAWHGAVELAKRRKAERERTEYVSAGAKAPTIDNRRKSPSSLPSGGEGEEGQILNEDGEWEDEESYRSRGEEAFDRIGTKLRRSRRLFLHDISDCPAKRAAFEILTELPVDWELAAQMQPQPDEPWRKPNMRQPDMLLTAENGLPRQPNRLQSPCNG